MGRSAGPTQTWRGCARGLRRSRRASEGGIAVTGRARNGQLSALFQLGPSPTAPAKRPKQRAHTAHTHWPCCRPWRAIAHHVHGSTAHRNHPGSPMQDHGNARPRGRRDRHPPDAGAPRLQQPAPAAEQASAANLAYGHTGLFCAALGQFVARDTLYQVHGPRSMQAPIVIPAIDLDQSASGRVRFQPSLWRERGSTRKTLDAGLPSPTGAGPRHKERVDRAGDTMLREMPPANTGRGCVVCRQTWILL